MKLCNSPANTSCMYQRRIARDAAMPNPDDDAGPDAYEALATFLQENLSPDVLAQGEELLRRFIDKSGGGNLPFAADEPLPFTGQPRVGGQMQALDRADLERRVAVSQQIRARRALAHNADLLKRFPNAARIRNV